MRAFFSEKKINRSYFIFLILTLLVSSLFIFYKYVTIPTQLAFDEVEFAKIALSLNNSSYIPYVTTAYGHATLYFYIILVSLKVFGVTTFGLRLPAALFGVASCVLFYLILTKTLKNSTVAFAGSFILATQRWFYTFARYSFEATFLLTLEFGSILSLVLFRQTNKWHYLAGTAILSGLAFHSYYPGRIFFLLPLLVLLFGRNLKHLAIFVTLFLITISPLALYQRSHPDIRINQLLVLSSSKLSTSEKVKELAENVKRNILYLYLNQGDMNGRHNYPGKAAVNPIMAGLITFGFFLALKKCRERINTLFLFFTLLAIIPPILVFSKENPNMLRSFTLLAPLAYFSVLSIIYIYKKIRLPKKLKIASVMLLLFASAYYDSRTYFLYQSEVFKHSFEVTCPLRTVLPMKPLKLSDIPLRCRTHSSTDLP